ncbi:2340_t:CDS:2 [Ambispora leptoticha]|uniref:2340_t:CDS:1 n=1 Tax=Ambispora leptoticha TaxID=144679 RepID=A0A9N9CRE6_9GLOM|nr:2340_t:CDS:2 [Ambispora leptoticha]
MGFFSGLCKIVDHPGYGNDLYFVSSIISIFLMAFATNLLSRSLSRQLQLQKTLIKCPKIYVSQQQHSRKINTCRTWARTNKGLKPQTCKYRISYSTEKTSQYISRENSATKTGSKIDEVDSSDKTVSQSISRENAIGKTESTIDVVNEPEQPNVDTSADATIQDSKSLIDKNRLMTENASIVESTTPLINPEQISSEQGLHRGEKLSQKGNQIPVGEKTEATLPEIVSQSSSPYQPIRETIAEKEKSDSSRKEPSDDGSFRNKFKEFSKIKLSSLHKLPIFLIISAIGLTSIGIYQFYSSNIQKYPETIRNNLKKGLYYQNYANNSNLAVDYYQKALTEALHSPELENSSPEVTGIMIQLGGLYEELGRFRDAIDVLSMAYDVIVTPNDSPPLKLDGQNRIKAIGIAQKIGDLCQTIKQDDLAEKYYVCGFWARLFGKKLDVDTMPSWMTAVDLGASLESLASFYALRHKYTSALPLYIRALQLVNSIELPCHTAVLMNNISEVFTGMGDLEVAQGWAERGLRITQEKSHLQKKNSRECDETRGVLLFNLGMIAERITAVMNDAKEDTASS